jgi:uncharacterized membrane protein YfcA
VVAVAIVIVVRYVVEVKVAVDEVVDVAVVVVANVVDVAVVVVVVTSAGPIAGAFIGTRTSATIIVQAMAKILIASCLFKTILSICWV